MKKTILNLSIVLVLLFFLVNMSSCNKSKWHVHDYKTTDEKLDTDKDRIPDRYDIDKDGDGLIEIYNLTMLNNVRYTPDSSGYRKSATAEKETRGLKKGKKKKIFGYAYKRETEFKIRGYELMRDLDFEDAKSYESNLINKKYFYGAGWTPISNFQGIFEGNGHIIKHFYINRPTYEGVGLFANIKEGEINNLGLENVSVFGGKNVGALVGHENSTNYFSVNHCWVVGGQIQGENKTGGLIGHAERVFIKNSYSKVKIIVKKKEAGGIIGSIGSAKIQNSFSKIDIIAENSDIGSDLGGIVGIVQARHGHSLVTDCYSFGKIKGTSYTAGIAGSKMDPDHMFELMISNCYFDGQIDTSEQLNIEGGIFPPAKHATLDVSHSYYNKKKKKEKKH